MLGLVGCCWTKRNLEPTHCFRVRSAIFCLLFVFIFQTTQEQCVTFFFLFKRRPNEAVRQLERVIGVESCKSIRNLLLQPRARRSLKPVCEPLVSLCDHFPSVRQFIIGPRLPAIPKRSYDNNNGSDDDDEEAEEEKENYCTKQNKKQEIVFLAYQMPSHLESLIVAEGAFESALDLNNCRNSLTELVVMADNVPVIAEMEPESLCNLKVFSWRAILDKKHKSDASMDHQSLPAYMLSYSHANECIECQSLSRLMSSIGPAGIASLVRFNIPDRGTRIWNPFRFDVLAPPPSTHQKAPQSAAAGSPSSVSSFQTGARPITLVRRRRTKGITNPYALAASSSAVAAAAAAAVILSPSSASLADIIARTGCVLLWENLREFSIDLFFEAQRRLGMWGLVFTYAPRFTHLRLRLGFLGYDLFETLEEVAASLLLWHKLPPIITLNSSTVGFLKKKKMTP